MRIKLIAGLTAAALSATLMATTPAQAESRTFAYGSYGSAKYEGVGPAKFKKSFNRSVKRNRSTLRFGQSDRRKNFSRGNRYKSRIKISR